MEDIMQNQRDIIKKFRQISANRLNLESEVKKRLNETKTRESENLVKIKTNLTSRINEYDAKMSDLSRMKKAYNWVYFALGIYIINFSNTIEALIISGIISAVALCKAISLWDMDKAIAVNEEKWNLLWYALIPPLPFLIGLYYLYLYHICIEILNSKYPNAITPEQKEEMIKKAETNKSINERIAEGDKNKSIQNAESTYNSSFGILISQCTSLGALSHKVSYPWLNEYWNTWNPTETQNTNTLVRIGSIIERDTWKAIKMPLFLPIGGIGGKNVMIKTPEEGKKLASETVKSMILRLLTLFPPGKLRFTLIDSMSAGKDLALFLDLKSYDENLVGTNVWTRAEDIESQLSNLKNKMDYISQNCLQNYRTIEDYNSANAGIMVEPYRILVVHNYPYNFSNSSIEYINDIARNGRQCGIYTLILIDSDKLSDRLNHYRDFHLEDIEKSSNIISWDTGKKKFVFHDDVFTDCELIVDTLFEEKRPHDQQKSIDRHIHSILNKVGEKASRKSYAVPFDNFVPSISDYWTESSINGLKVPIGLKGTATQYLELSGQESHALVAGSIGTGKSNFFHVLITELSLVYPPEELELYLIDFKKVEFPIYASYHLPHARVISFDTDREFTLSVIKHVCEEMERRINIFQDVKVNNIIQYRKETRRQMPRILVLVDEFHELFTKNDVIADNIAEGLNQLVRLGRSFGIHVILGSQNLSGTISFCNSFFSEMAVRIAFRCEDEVSRTILAYDNPAARDLEISGQAIYNAKNGRIKYNKIIQVALLEGNKTKEYLSSISKKAQDKKYIPPHPQIIFSKKSFADLRRNRKIEMLNKNCLQKPINQVSIWIGEPIEIKEPISVNLRNQRRSNLIIFGIEGTVAAGIISASLIAIALQYKPSKAKFFIINFGVDDDACIKIIDRTYSYVKNKIGTIEIINSNDFPRFLETVNNDIERRLQSHENEVPCYVVIFGLQITRDLSGNNYDMNTIQSKCHQHFSKILESGPSAGVHLLVWCDRYNNFTLKLDYSLLEEFDYRVALQMDERESFNVINSYDAKKLNLYRAIFYNKEKGTLEKFIPYKSPLVDEKS